MNDVPLAVQALVEAGRQARLLDPVSGNRLVQAAAAGGATDVAALHRLLDAGIAGIERCHRLARLLADPAATLGAWRPLARLPGLTGQSWLAADAFGALALLRILPPAALADDAAGADEARRRFEREATVCRKLEHPNLLRLLDGGATAQGAVWFALEHCPAGDLALRLRLHGGRLDEEAVLAMGAQISAALAELARQGLVHRAVSPTSILIGPDGTAKLGEFGLARSLAGAMTYVGAGGGGDAPPWWQAPELLDPEARIGPATDVYALGCVLFACLAGRPPFIGDVPEVLHGHADLPPPDLTEVAVPPPGRQTARIITACLAKDAAQRPDADALRAALSEARALIRQRASSDRLLHASGVQPRPTTQQRRRGLALAGTLAEVHLGDLLQTLQRMQATGTLVLVDPAGRRRRIALANGLPAGMGLEDVDDLAELAERLADLAGDSASGILARVDGAEPEAALDRLTASGLGTDVLREALTGQLFDALCRRFAGSEESFTFEAAGDGPGDGLAAQALVVKVEHLAMEAARQADDRRRLAARLPGPWAVPQPDHEQVPALQAEFNLYPERCVLAALDGLTPLGSLHRRARTSAFAALRFCADLQERGLLEWVEPEPALVRSRALLAEGRPAPALALARAALAARPLDDQAAGYFAICLAAMPDADAPAATRTGLAPSAGPEGDLVGDLEGAFAGPWLALVSSADGQGAAVHLYAGDELVLGKLAKPPVQVTLRVYPELRFQAESNRISRVHCRLAWRGDAAAVADLGSGNGTRLDNQPLVAEREVALPARESVLEVAGVVRLGLRPVRGWQGLPPPPSDLDAAGPGALVVERQANRPELAYALVRNRVVIGGSGSELVVPGAGLGPQVVVARCRDHWLWAAWKSQTWRPIVPGEAIALGGISLTAVAGDHRLFH